MVTKRRYINHTDGPPPLDESWWEAVLAEEEANNHRPPRRVSAPERLPAEEESAGRPTAHPQPAGQVVSSPNGRFSPPETAPASTIDWEKARALYENDQVIELEVSGFNRGGLLVNGEQLQGFVPISHLIESPCPSANAEQMLQKHVGRRLLLKVIECDPERGRVVFSERAAQAEPGSRRQLLNSLRPGDCAVGTVTNITEFGIFVDLGGVEGLVHVSEISWGRVHHPAEIVSLGQEVKVYVISVDQERARVALSLKRLHANPWETAELRYYPGQITEATVTSLVPFGAFARLEEGLDGLIHISEMGGTEAPARPEEVLSEGQRVKVRILHIDAARQRLGLSLRLQTPPNEPIL